MKKLLIKNWRLKILALVSAVILWLFVIGIENTVSLFPREIEVEILNMNESVGISQSLPGIKVYVNADKEIIKNFAARDFTAQVDLKGLTAGEHTVPVNVFSNNPQVRVVRAEPEEVRVTLSPLIEREIEVMISYTGAPASKYRVQSVEAEPNKVTVSAVKTVLDKIKNVEAKFTLNGTETADKEQKVTLEIPENIIVSRETVIIKPEQAVVRAKIVSDIKDKEVPVRVNFNGTADEEGWRGKVSLNPEKVKIIGENIEKIEFIETAPVDIAKLLNSRDIQTVGLILPINVSLAEGEPVVSVSLRDSAETEKEVNATVTLTGRNSLYKIIKYTPPEFKVTVTGAASVLNELKSGSVIVEFNISSVTGNGDYSISETNIIVPDGVFVKSFTPDGITVEAESLASI